MLLHRRVPSTAPPPSLTYKRSFYPEMKRRLPLSNRCCSTYKSRRVISRGVFLRRRCSSTLRQSQVLVSGAAEWPNQLGLCFFSLLLELFVFDDSTSVTLSSVYTCHVIATQTHKRVIFQLRRCLTHSSSIHAGTVWPLLAGNSSLPASNYQVSGVVFSSSVVHNISLGSVTVQHQVK